MKALAAAALATCCALAFNAWATNPQQERMAACNKEATGKKGDERKQFMKQCLSAKKDAANAKSSRRAG
jgi:hypothetical protein